MITPASQDSGEDRVVRSLVMCQTTHVLFINAECYSNQSIFIPTHRRRSYSSPKDFQSLSCGSFVKISTLVCVMISPFCALALPPTVTLDQEGPPPPTSGSITALTARTLVAKVILLIPLIFTLYFTDSKTLMFFYFSTLEISTHLNIDDRGV